MTTSLGGLICFQPDTTTPLGEIVVHVISFPATNEKILPSDTIVAHCCYNDSIAQLLQIILGSHNIPYDVEFVYCGRILNRNDVIPLECFEPHELLDSVSLTFRSRITLVILAEKAHFIQGINNDIQADSIELLQKELLEKEHQKRREKELYEQQLIEQSNVECDVPKFNLLENLQQIECGFCYEPLKLNGFDQEGTFALLSESDFIDLNINIPLRAKNRIMELVRYIGDNLKQQQLMTETKSLLNKSRINKHNNNNVENFAILSEPKLSRLEEKIQNIKNRLQYSQGDEKELRSKVKDVDNIPCCVLHHSKVKERKLSIKNLNIVRFKTDVSTRLDWLQAVPQGNTPFCTAFASFDEMFSVAWVVIQQWQQKSKYSSSRHQEVEKKGICRWLEQSSVLSVGELNAIEDTHVVHNNWRTISEVAYQHSLIVGYVHSKDKFVDAIVQYLELVDPLFFLLSE